MKISIQNWGPIASCEYDISKPLSVTYGNNNIGKSYAMQMVYLTLKHMIRTAEYFLSSFYYFEKKLPKGRWKDVLIEFADSERDELDITDDVLDNTAEYIRAILFPLYRESVFHTFETVDSTKDSVVSVTFSNTSLKVAPYDESLTVKRKIKNTVIKKTESSFHKSRNAKYRTTFYVVKNQSGTMINEAISLIEDKVIDEVRNLLHDFYSQIGECYYLPASRSGITVGMNAIGQALASLSQNRYSYGHAISIPSIPEPIADYYFTLSSIRPQLEGRYSHIASQIESAVLDGEIRFDNKRKVLVYRQNGREVDLDMTDSSSMVAEISPIIAFLKYVIGANLARVNRGRKYGNKQKTILFIEEPEAHLHPINQVKLISNLHKSLDERLTVVMSTHSNYILNKLNNLILERSLDENTYEAILMTKEEDNQSYTKHMTMDRFGVDDENFLDISNELYDEREELLESLFDNEEEPDN